MRIIPFIEPTGPDCAPINALHRGHDGHIAFSRRDKLGRFEPCFNALAVDTPEVFPQFIAPHVDEESWYSINGMWMRPGERRTPSRLDPRFPMAKWGTERLRWLTAAYVDIDCYKIGCTIGQAIGACIDAQDSGRMPAVSMFKRSGRGLWLFWMLHDDENRDSPVRAWSEAIGTYKRIERELVDRFRGLGSDDNAKDAARITRVPGSLHRSTQTRVAYWIQADQDGRPISYRLDELAVAVGVAPTKYRESIARVVAPRSNNEGQKKGYQSMHAKRLAMLLELIDHRGTIKEGCRNSFALIFAATLRGSGVDVEGIREELWKFGLDQCTPPLKDDEIGGALASAQEKHWRFSNFTVGEMLKVTQDEAEMIGLPPRGSRPRSDDAELRTREQRRTARREKIRTFVTKLGHTPPLRRLCEFIEKEMGEKPSTRTIKDDLAAMGFSNPRRWRKETQAVPLFDSGSIQAEEADQGGVDAERAA